MRISSIPKNVNIQIGVFLPLGIVNFFIICYYILD